MAAARERGEELRLPEGTPLEPAVDRLQPWSKLAIAHGAYFVLSGAWPLVHLRSFESVTGTKLEGWLAKGVGACWVNVGVHLIRAGLQRGRARRDERGFAVRTALTFAAFDFYYAGFRRRISPAYLVNGFLQLAFVALWGAERIAEQRALSRPPMAAHA
jgi:hypothetical protein